MNYFKPYTLNVGGDLLTIDRPWIMGILNVTPDSFYDGSRCNVHAKIESRVRQLIDEGADIIDIGGYSSRPFADDISPDEEYSRLAEGLKLIRDIAPDAIVSVDTFRASVARRCVEEYGVGIINDISGGDLDENMYATVASLGVPYVLMHMRGNPHTMTTLTDYDDVVVDVIRDLAKKIDRLGSLGATDVIVDPGFGFSKNVQQNFRLMAQLEEFTYLDHPLLVGISRKSMIYKSLGITPADSLNGTTALNTIALMKGANILRVHDVKAAVETMRLVTTTMSNT